MDVILDAADNFFFTPYIYPKWIPEDNMLRQFISLNIITDIGGALLYLIMATFSYVFIFDKTLMTHPHVLKNQAKLEMQYALWSVPFMGLPTSVLFVGEVRGYSKLYDNVQDSNFGWYAIALSVVTFIFFTDCLIYWIHRFLHHRLVYKRIHKPHHKWKVPTPFASHAFHPIDGFLQSVPYHVYVFCFPMHKFTYLTLFVLVNVWTVSIHDGDYRVPELLKPIINGSAHHMDHHVYYNYNYGQYFTLWDRIGGSFRSPSSFEGCGPMDEIKKRMQDGKGAVNGYVKNGDVKKVE